MSTKRNGNAGNPDQLDNAALFALGLASPDEAASAPEDVTAKLRDAAYLLAECVLTVPAPPGLKDRLMARVSQFEQLKPAADVRRNEAAWTATGIPGIAIQPLFTDTAKRTSTLLMRMDPGTSYPAHNHHGAEQCMVL